MELFLLLATVLIFGNSFTNALSISSFENKAGVYNASQAKLDNTLSDRSNKVVMINFDDGRKSQLIYAKPILVAVEACIQPSNHYIYVAGHNSKSVSTRRQN